MLPAKRFLFLAIVLCGSASPAWAYIDRPPTLGRLVQYDARDIIVMRVEKVSREKEAILYRKVADLKGQYPADRIRQHVARHIADQPGAEDNPRPRGGQSILDWARPGKLAVFVHDADHKASATCVGNAWYFGWEAEGGWWAMNEFEERGLAWAYVGSVEKLREDVAAILAGKEVVVTAAQYDPYGGGERELWNNQTAYRNLARDNRVRLWRIRASTQIISLTDALVDRPHFVVGLGSGDRDAVPALVRRLQGKDSYVRARAAEELGQVGPEAAAAVPALTAALGDADGRVRVNAAEALWQVSGKAEAAVPALAAAVKEKDDQVRRLAAEVLWRMGPQAAAAVPALADALRDGDREVRRDAAATLWRVGPRAKAAIPALAAALKDDDREVRRSAAGALGTFGPEAGTATAALIDALQDKDLRTRYFAARTLVRVGSPAARQAAVPVLREVLHAVPDQRVRTEIIVFLWKTGPQPESVFPTLKSGDAGDVSAATQLPAKADRETRKNAVPTLVAALRGAKSDPGYRASFARVLGQLGPDAAAAVPALTELLKDRDESVRGAAAEALKQIRPK